MKGQAAIVIAALMIASMGILTPTTTVTAYTNQATVSITQTTVRDNAAVLITLTVTNPSATENVENILIKDVTTGITTWFSTPYGGNENVAENWDNVADNLIALADNMANVRDNMLNAVTLIKNAGAALIDFANAENTVANYLVTFVENDNVWKAGYNLGLATPYWKNVGTILQSEPFNFGRAAENMRYAAGKESTAGQELYRFTGLIAPDNTLRLAGENIRNAAHYIDNWAGDNLENAILGWVGHDLENVRFAWENAGKALGSYPAAAQRYTQMQLAANYMENYMAKAMANVVENIRRASLALDNAATALSKIENFYLDNAQWIDFRYDRDVASTVTNPIDNLLDVDAVENISNAAVNLDLTTYLGYDNYDNILRAAENLKNAALSFDVANWIGPLFASEIIGWYGETSTTSVRYYIERAGENMDNENNLNLTTAANNLYSAGQRLKDAGNTLKTTKALLSPTTGYGLQTGGVAGNYGVLFSPIMGDNKITAGTSKTFSFFWTAPDISTEQAHTIRVWTYNHENTASTPTDFTITVNGQVAKGSMVISQTDVTCATSPWTCGRNYDNGQFTITVTATKAISAIGQVYIENWSGTGEVVAGPFTLTSTDSLVWTATVSTTSWLDNWENLKVRVAAPWATDLLGLENTENLIDNLIFDTKKPIIVDNGLSLLGGLTQEVKPGTTTTYRRTSDATWTINVRAEDNWVNVDNTKWCTVTILCDNVETTTTQSPNDNWEAQAVFADGAHTIKLIVTDRVGNSVENTLTNVYVDNTPPTVEFVSVNGVAWTDNNLQTNDNTVTIVLTIHDAGWGIVRNAGGNVGAQYENVWVYLDNDDNLNNGENILLDNLGVWDNGNGTTTQGRFENTYDNYVSGVAKGLRSGYWYVVVKVGDNVQSQAGSHIENENYSQRFYIDVSKPTITTPGAAQNPLDGTTISDPSVQTTTSLTIRGTGMTSEVGATIKIYMKNATTGTTAATDNTTVGSDGNWLKIITLPAAGTKYQIEVTCVDLAGNESTSVLYGYVLTDGTAPAAEIISPATGSTAAQATISVSGTIGKDTWETYNSGTSTMTVVATIQVNTGTAATLQINSDGTFSTSAGLSLGNANTITVTAHDSAGNTTVRTVTLLPDTTAPTVSLGTLPTATDAASVTVTGTVTKDTWETYSNITVNVQGATSGTTNPDSSGNFSVTIGLGEGANTITVQAVDQSSNTSNTVTATITRTVTPWATYAIVIVIITLVLAAIAIFRKR